MIRQSLGPSTLIEHQKGDHEQNNVVMDVDMDARSDSDSGIDDCVQVGGQPTTHNSKTPQVVIYNNRTSKPTITRSGRKSMNPNTMSIDELYNKPQRKRARHSDPGPIRVNENQVKRRRRRQTLPASSNRNETETEATTTVMRFYPLSARLSARVIRRCKRNNMSAEMNLIENEDKERRKKEKELRQLREEIKQLRTIEQEREKTMKKSRLSNVQDAAKIWELEGEVERLKGKISTEATTSSTYLSTLESVSGHDAGTDTDVTVEYDDDYYGGAYGAASDDDEEVGGDKTVMQIDLTLDVDEPSRQLRYEDEADEGVSLSQDPPSSQLKWTIEEEERGLRIQAEANLDRVQKEFQVLQDEHDECLENISALEEKLRMQQEERKVLAEIQATQTDKDMELIQKQATIDDLTERLESSVEAQKRRADMLLRLEVQAEELGSIIERLEESQQQLAAEKEQLGKLLCDGREQNKSLQENVNVKDSQLSELRSYVASREKEVNDLRAELKQANEALNSVDAERQEQEEQILSTIESIEARLADAVQARFDVEQVLTEKIKQKKATIKSLREQLLLTERECRETKETLQDTRVELEVTQRAGKDLREQLEQKVRAEQRMRKGIEKQMRRFSEGVYGLMNGNSSRRSDSGVGTDADY